MAGQPKTEDWQPGLLVKSSTEHRDTEKDIKNVILKKYMHRTEEDEQDGLASDMSEKEFDNIVAEARSPRAMSPPFDSLKLEVREWDLAAPRAKVTEKRTAVLFLLHVVLSSKLALTMPIRIIGHGGLYFFIPLIICSCVLAAPIVFLELALGQYTSQLALPIFARMLPIASGIGWSMLWLRSLYSVAIRSDHRFMALMWEYISSQVVDARPDVCPKHIISGLKDCVLKRACEGSNLMFYEGQCYNFADFKNSNGTYTYHTQVRILTRKLLQDIQKNAVHDVMPIPDVSRVLGVLDHNYPGAHKLDGLITFFFICLIFAVYGVNVVSALSPFVLGFAVLSATFCFVLMTIDDFCRTHFFHFFAALNSDITQLFQFNTWLLATEIAFVSLSIGDGTLHSIGSMNHFTNNIFFDVFVLCVVNVVFLFIGTILSGWIFTLGLLIQNNEISTSNISSSDIRMLMTPYRENLPFIVPYYYFGFKSAIYMIIITVVAFAVLFLQMGNHVLQAENLLISLCRFMPFLQGLNGKVIRHTIVLVYFVITACVTYCHTYARNHPWMVEQAFIIPLVLVLWECWCVAHQYSVDRFYVNIRTMLSANSRAYSKMRYISWPLYYTWKYAIIFLIGVLLMINFYFKHYLEDFSLFLVVLIQVTCFPLFAIVFRYTQMILLKEEIRPLKVPMPTWGPNAVRDKRDADYDERAARILV